MFGPPVGFRAFAIVLGLGAGVTAVGACGASADGGPTAITGEGDSDGKKMQGPDGPLATDNADGGPAAAGPPSRAPGPPNAFRALIALTPRSDAALTTAIGAMYTPGGAQFRQYLTTQGYQATYAPTDAEVSTVRTYLQSNGFVVSRVSTSKRLIEFTGTIGAYQTAFKSTVKITGSGSTLAYKLSKANKIPAAIAASVTAILAPDTPASTTPLGPDTGTVKTSGPSDANEALQVAAIAHAYDLDGLTAGGFHGEGMAIGIVGAGAVRLSDVRSFWQSQGILRNDPVVVTTATAPSGYNAEATLDVEWSGGIAPNAAVRFYQAPDTDDTSLVYAFDEAIANGAVSIVTDSFSHHESSTPEDARRQYDASAKMAAALGITVVSASGDTGAVDVPEDSPWVTAVGGTTLTLKSNGSISSEEAWSTSGCGVSVSFAAPAWQTTGATGGMRAVVDISLNADNLFMYEALRWQIAGGTSFASPTTAGIFAVINSARAARGLGHIGFLNSILYSNAATQGAFRDITTGDSAGYSSGAGWDNPTGFGVPDATKLAAALP